MDQEEFQEEVYEWSSENFEDQPPQLPLVGAGEETGELTTSVLKRAQGIDDSDKYDGIVGDEAEQDAVGDIVIYLADFVERWENVDEKPPDEIMTLLDFYISFGSLCEAVFRRLDDERVRSRHDMVLASLEAFCEERGFDMDECTKEAWEEVSGRGWDSDVEVKDE